MSPGCTYMEAPFMSRSHLATPGPNLEPQGWFALDGDENQSDAGTEAVALHIFSLMLRQLGMRSTG